MKFWSLVSLLLISTLPALAHHSFAMFDFNKVAKAHAVVQEFRWTNPHVVLLIKVESGEVPAGKTWSLELTSPGNLTRTGWSRKSFKAGDVIDVEFNPLRDGRQGGAFRKASIPATGVVLESNIRAQEKPGLE
ncbi:MAG: DUF6152 family protein [Polyangiales bacterium]